MNQSPLEHDDNPKDNPETWVDAYGNVLYSYAIVRVRDAKVAEDLVQETYLAALKSKSNFSDKSSMRTWLVGILKHKIIDHFRKISRERQTAFIDDTELEEREEFQESGRWKGHWREEKYLQDWGENPEDILVRKEFMEVFSRCLSKLPDRLADIFVLREIEATGTDEICKVLDISPTNLWVMMHRARMRVRRCIERNWLSDIR